MHKILSCNTALSRTANLRLHYVAIRETYDLQHRLPPVVTQTECAAQLTALFSAAWPTTESQLAGEVPFINTATKGCFSSTTHLTTFTLSQQYFNVLARTEFPVITCELIRKEMIRRWEEQRLTLKVPFF